MSTNAHPDPFNARETFDTRSGNAHLYRLSSLTKAGYDIDRLPFSIRILLEGRLRNCDGMAITADDIKRLASYDPKAPANAEIPFMPALVLLQDFTGVPAVVVLADMRHALARLCGDQEQINQRV